MFLPDTRYGLWLLAADWLIRIAALVLDSHALHASGGT